VITEPVLIDTGPLVALLNRYDSHHDACREQAKLIQGPVFTSWLVITEAAWLVRGFTDGLVRLLQLLEDRDIVCLHLDGSAMRWLASVALRFPDMAPQLADLSILYLAEQQKVNHIFTLDRRDFAIYRSTSGEPFRLLPETI
jgi:predicted nucleic acid-binding protein